MPEQHTTEVEVWKPIPLTEGWYEASSFGRIRSIERVVNSGGKGRGHTRAQPGIILTLNINRRHGYVQVAVQNRRTCRVHKLIADAFIGPCPDGMEVNHKNGNRQNNRADNLEYVTRGDNHRHAYRTLGRWNNTRRLTDEQVAEIRRQHAAGEGSYAELGRRHGMNHWHIRSIVKGRCHKGI